MEEEEEVKVVEDYYYPVGSIPNPITIFWGIKKLICFKLIKIIYNLISILLSPLFFLLSLASETFYQAEVAKERVESSVHAAVRVPSDISHKTMILVRKMGVGFVSAVYVCMVVIMLMTLAIVLGVGLVQLWVEEPVFVRERLHFDYTDIHPNAVFSFWGCHGEDQFINPCRKKKMGLVPVDHTFSVSLVLLLPETDFNLQIGVFQLTAELISTNGYVRAKSSQPCTLQFRSLPIRLMRTILMAIPLLLGITSETQKVILPMLKHTEGYPRTEAIRISMIPRPVGTSFVPQLYEAKIIIKSQLPWRKEIVRRWKWTFCVWTSIYIYIMLLIIIVCWFKPLIFPMTRRSNSLKRSDQQEVTMKVGKKQKEIGGKEEKEVSEELTRWKQSRRKRKAMLLQRVLSDGGSSASSTTITKEEQSVASTITREEQSGDSELISFSGSTC